jgi:hypothetical protein
MRFGRELTSDDLMDVFEPAMPSGVRHRRMEIANRNGRFVHYTSAENALKIIQTQEVWMRNVRCMDDYTEVRHGYEMLQELLTKPEHEKKFCDAIDQYAEGAGREAITAFIRWGKDNQFNTYISSISEHDDTENDNGRLSMWRAFGGLSTRAAIVLKLPLTRGSTKGLNLWLSPVSYFRYEDVEKYFLEFIQNLDGLISKVILTSADRKVLVSIISSMLVMSAVSLKHEGFREEKEWRVIYMPEMAPTPLMLKKAEIIKGVPQIVYKLPLKNNSSEAVVGIEIPQLVDRVIIGPSAYPDLIQEAFVVALQEAGMTDTENRVVCSGIPVRT